MSSNHLIPISHVVNILENQLSQDNLESWTRPLSFMGCLVHPNYKPALHLFKIEDLVECTNNPIYKNCKIYFNKEQYNPSCIEGITSNKINSKDPAWHLLTNDIIREAHAAGMSLIANGTVGFTTARKIICNCGIFYEKRCI